VTRFNYKGLFAGNPDNVTVVQASDGRVIGIDHYSLWDLTLVCKAQGIEVPAPGRYRAMVKELRRTNTDPGLPGDKVAELFDHYTDGIDPENRLALSEWATDRHRPIIHTRTADVRLIGTAYDAIPRLGTGSYWVACNDWEHLTTAVKWGMAEQAPFGVVQLIGNARDRGSWNLDAHMAFAFATACEDIAYETVVQRYGNPVGRAA